MRNKCRNADSTIKAGDLILSEEPFVYVLSSKEKGSRCDQCMEKGKVLKCSGCQFVHYCGRACQRDAWNDHKWECSNLKRISPKVIPDAARMVAKIINRLNRGDGNSYRAYYTATSFRMWKDLMSHYPDLKSDKKRMDHFTTICMVLYEFMRDVSLPNTVELMGLYGRMVINSFTILDIDMNSIGTGIYLAASVVDHSCNPNAVATFNGKTISIRALMDIPTLDWEQIRISYIDLMKTPLERQTELLQNYYFLCQCERCLDESHHAILYSAKCPNIKCDNPINIPYKSEQLVIKAESQNGTDNRESNVLEKDSNCENGIAISVNEVENTVSNGCKKEGDSIEKDDMIHCSKCGAKYTDKHLEVYTNTVEFTDLHLQDMKGASVAYVDVCKFCLERQEGILHPLNLLHAQTLDHAFDAFIQVQLWDKACVYAERLIPCFHFYYGDRHPLLGILHLKYGKILLLKMELQKALEQLKLSEKILKITHGDKHPLYRDQLLPLLRQALMELS